MESFSDDLRMRLAEFLRLWLQEKGSFNELHITPTQILLEAQEYMEAIDIADALKFSARRIILEQFKRDLRIITDRNYQRPNYWIEELDERLPKLVQLMKQTNIRRKNNLERLELYFYVGEALSLRG